MRDDPVQTDPIIDPGRSVYVWSAIGWLTNSRWIAEELSKVAHTIKCWSGHSPSDSDTGLVTAVLKGLKHQSQDDGLLSINAFEPGMTGHDLQTWEEGRVEKIFDELTGAPLDPEHARREK